MRSRKTFILFLPLFLASVTSCLSLVDKKALAKDYAAIGEGYYELKQYEKAESFFSRASELDPKLPLNSFLLAKTFAENGQYDRSIALINELTAKEPDNTVYLGLKAYILQKTEKTDEALACLDRVLALSPYSKDALFNKGIIQFADKDFQGAYESWDKLVNIDPKDSEAIMLLAKAAFKTEKADTGFSLLEQYSALKPDDSAALRLRAKMRNERREYSLALQAYEALVAKDPNQASDWFELALLAMQAAEDKERSLEAFGKSMELGFKDQERAQKFIESLPEGDREPFKKLIPAKKEEPAAGGEQGQEKKGEGTKPEGGT